MSYHSNTLSLQQVGDNSNEHVYFSRITEQWEPVWFYATMLKKLGSFAQAIDRCSSTSRELVWSHIFSLYNQPNRKCSDLFGPIIDEWCHSQAIDLSAIEIMYTSFLQMYNQYPGLFEDMLAPAPSPLSAGEREPLSYSGGLFADGKMIEFKKEEPKPKPIKLSNTSLIWGNSFPASIQQFSLLLNWAPLLEKLPPNQKEAIWNTCQFFPLFTESFDRSSFRKTFLKWASNLYAHLSHITILFASIGFLRDKGIIKHQFFYPNTTLPVFNNGTKTQSPPASQYYPPSSPHPHFTPSSPLSSPSSSPSLSSHSSPSSATSRSPSPASSGPGFQSQPLHHFYSQASSPSHPHPVLPTLDGMRTAKSLPFDSLSLPPLSLPSAPLPTPSPAPGTSSSRLGLLALAAFQVDDTEAPQQPGAAFPLLAPRQSQPTPPLKDQQDASTSTPTPTKSGPTPPLVKVEEETKRDPRPPNPKLPVSTSPTPSNNTPMETPTSTEQKESVTSTPSTALPKKEPAAIMKIGKRKNSSCSDYHDDDSKRPRPMNLSHILCS